MFPCRCGHGFLRKVDGEEDTTGYHLVPAARRKKRQKQKPKLNQNPKMVSQKGVGEYFRDPLLTEKVSESTISRAKTIPGLSVEGEQPKPLWLNLDLTAIQLTEIKPGDAPRPPPTSDTDSRGEDIFISDEEQEEEEEVEEVEKEGEEQNKTELCSRLIVENTELRRDNEEFELRMRAERRMYQEFQEELLRENLKLEMKSRDLDSSMQKLKSDLEEKENEINQLVVESSGRLGVSDEISARRQSQSDVRIVDSGQNTGRLDNNLLTKLSNFIIREMFSFFDMM